MSSPSISSNSNPLCLSWPQGQPDTIHIDNNSGTPWTNENDIYQYLLDHEPARSQLIWHINMRRINSEHSTIYLHHPSMTNPMVFHRSIRHDSIRNQAYTRLSKNKEEPLPPIPRNQTPLPSPFTTVPLKRANSSIISPERRIPFTPDNSLIAYNWEDATQVYDYLINQQDERLKLLEEVRERIDKKGNDQIFLITHPLIPGGIRINTHMDDKNFLSMLQKMCSQIAKPSAYVT
jgi:hypothetical protein